MSLYLLLPWLGLGFLQAGLLASYVNEQRPRSMEAFVVLVAVLWLFAPLVLVMWLSVGAVRLGGVLVRGIGEWKRELLPRRPIAPRDEYLEAAQREVEVMAPEGTAESHILGTR